MIEKNHDYIIINIGNLYLIRQEDVYDNTQINYFLSISKVIL